MSDPNRLEQIAGDLRKVAKQCSDASHTLQQQTQQLDWSSQDLAEGVGKWAGKGSQSFLSAWYQYHQDTRRSASSLDQTAQALNKLAQTIEDNVQAIRNAQAQEAAGFLITGGLVLLDIVQLGLDPVTDAATVGAGGADAALIEEAQAAEEAIVEMDSQVSGEIDEIASQVENSSEPGDVNIPDDTPSDGIDMTDDGSGNTDTGGGAGGGDSVNAYRVQGGQSKERLLVTSEGNIEIQGNDTLFLNFNQEQRAFEFLERRGNSAYIVRFKVKSEFLDFLRSVGVEEREARLFPDRPLKVDLQYPDQFGIRSNLFNELLEYIVPGSAEVINP